MADYDLGTARGTIELDASALARASAAFDLLGNKMLLIGGIAIAAFGYAVKSAADFEEQMSRFGAVGNATENQMEAIRAKALQLGRDSAYGATEVVKAFTELAYAGATTKEIVEGLGDATVYLAAAGEVPLADAATVLINTLRQFNLTGKDAVGVADEIARAANASTISIDDLNTSLRYVGPTAAQLGLTFNDVAEALAILGNQGIRGSTAGTSLRGVLVGLLATSGPAKEALHELGLDTNEVGNNFFTAEGKLRSFKDISELLRGAMGHLGQSILDESGNVKSAAEIDKLLEDSTLSLTDKTKLQAFAHLFQRRAMGAAFALAKDGAHAFDNLTSSAQYNTTAQEIMTKKLDNLKGSLKILKASIETFAITIGEYFTPYLKLAADFLRELVNGMEKLPGPIKQIIGFALVFGGSFLVVGGAMSKVAAMSIKSYKAFSDLGGGIKILFGLLGKVGAAFQALGVTLLTNPIFLVIAAIALLVVGFYLLYTKSETFRRGIRRIWAALQEVWEWIKDNWDVLLAILLAPFTGFLSLFYVIWKYFGDDIKNGAKDIWKTVSQFFENLYKDVTKWISEAIQNVISWFERLPGVIANYLKQALNFVLDFLASLPRLFGYALGFVIGLVISFGVKLVTFLIETGVKVITWLVDFIASFIEKSIQWGIDFIAAVIEFFSQLPGILLGFLLAALEALFNFVAQFIAKVIEWGVAILTWTINFLSQLPGLIWGFLLQALDFIINFVGQVIGWIINMGIRVLEEAWNFFSQLPGQIIAAIGDAGSMLWNVGVQIIEGLIGGIGSVIGDLWDTIGDIAGGIVDGISDALDVLSPSKKMDYVGRMVVAGLVQGMDRSKKSLQRPIDDISRHLQLLGGIQANMYGAPGGGAGYGSSTTTSSSVTNIQINNPVGEPAEDSLSRTMQKLAYVGVAG